MKLRSFHSHAYFEKNKDVKKIILGTYEPVRCVGWAFKGLHHLSYVGVNHEFISHPHFTGYPSLIKAYLTESILQRRYELYEKYCDFYGPIVEGVALAETHFNNPDEYEIAKQLEGNVFVKSIAEEITTGIESLVKGMKAGLQTSFEYKFELNSDLGRAEFLESFTQGEQRFAVRSDLAGKVWRYTQYTSLAKWFANEALFKLYTTSFGNLSLQNFLILLGRISKEHTCIKPLDSENEIRNCIGKHLSHEAFFLAHILHLANCLINQRERFITVSSLFNIFFGSIHRFNVKLVREENMVIVKGAKHNLFNLLPSKNITFLKTERPEQIASYSSPTLTLIYIIGQSKEALRHIRSEILDQHPIGLSAIEIVSKVLDYLSRLYKKYKMNQLKMGTAWAFIFNKLEHFSEDQRLGVWQESSKKALEFLESFDKKIFVKNMLELLDDAIYGKEAEDYIQEDVTNSAKELMDVLPLIQTSRARLCKNLSRSPVLGTINRGAGIF